MSAPFVAGALGALGGALVLGLVGVRPRGALFGAAALNGALWAGLVAAASRAAG